MCRGRRECTRPSTPPCSTRGPCPAPCRDTRGLWICRGRSPQSSTAPARPCASRCGRRATRKAAAPLGSFLAHPRCPCRRQSLPGRFSGRSRRSRCTSPGSASHRSRQRRTFPPAPWRDEQPSASPRLPVSSAWPVNCATTLTSMPVLGFEQRQDVAKEPRILR